MFVDNRGQFHQCFTRAFFVQKFVLSQNVTRKKAFVRKICAFKVDDVNRRSSFQFFFLEILIFTALFKTLNSA